jgi:hypothetical protein
MEDSINAKQWYAMILTAATTRTEVRVGVLACHSGMTVPVKIILQDYDE